MNLFKTKKMDKSEIHNIIEVYFSRDRERLNNLQKKVEELEFELHNPPKYKKGDKVSKGKYIVIGVKQKQEGVGLTKFGYSFYKTFWHYELIEIITGEKTTLREDKI